ncbi:hypothetical protein SISSUDRAFT_1043656 [Sistotremastrum suecicum HHB10207 ss-3]|uniref:Uncharacterized protein n=1 Tax=Sistotremastrum suecicum HHB10207 ss-3 TaxID=1314776 RepID=A0A166FQJ3_9AGAM|nr:hypothetical protein SISSUDRAFT_1043656 [Sistotremastrum suecicum HHB10207 ss-3]
MAPRTPLTSSLVRPGFQCPSLPPRSQRRSRASCPAYTDTANPATPAITSPPSLAILSPSTHVSSSSLRANTSGEE